MRIDSWVASTTKYIRNVFVIVFSFSRPWRFIFSIEWICAKKNRTICLNSLIINWTCYSGDVYWDAGNQIPYHIFIYINDIRCVTQENHPIVSSFIFLLKFEIAYKSDFRCWIALCVHWRYRRRIFWVCARARVHKRLILIMAFIITAIVVIGARSSITMPIAGCVRENGVAYTNKRWTVTAIVFKAPKYFPSKQIN